MMNIFHSVSEQCSKITTEAYSTSFASAIRLLHKDLRTPIYNIYGFVRFADEIVDTFHDHDKSLLLQQFKIETFEAIKRKISLNPILHSFQQTVNCFKIDIDLVHAFFASMEQDLNKIEYDQSSYKEYIYGSAEVVGLMCLYVFCEGEKALFESLKSYAQSLGAAFQKVNFLRDIKADSEQLERMYFPGCSFQHFSQSDKTRIEEDIQKDFEKAFVGIINLPMKARFGVYVAYKYYLTLFRKIKRINATEILNERIRIPNYGKVVIVAKAGLRSQFNML